MQDMKFRVQDKEHSAAIQKKLFESGCQWCDGSKVVKHTDMPCLYVENDRVGFSSNDDGEYHFFNGEAMPEGVLTPQGTLLPASEYFVYPSTEYAKHFPCVGCKPGECAGCGDDDVPCAVNPQGHITAAQINSTRITIKDAAGNVLFERKEKEDTVEKTYAPLPILSRNEHERKRVAELLATIAQANDTNDYVHSDWLDELVSLVEGLNSRREEF